MNFLDGQDRLALYEKVKLQMTDLKRSIKHFSVSNVAVKLLGFKETVQRDF